MLTGLSYSVLANAAFAHPTMAKGLSRQARHNGIGELSNFRCGPLHRPRRNNREEHEHSGRVAVNRLRTVAFGAGTGRQDWLRAAGVTTQLSASSTDNHRRAGTLALGGLPHKYGKSAQGASARGRKISTSGEHGFTTPASFNLCAVTPHSRQKTQRFLKRGHVCFFISRRPQEPAKAREA
jgi:hypothetical protein